jgi:hypothetical protein
MTENTFAKGNTDLNNCLALMHTLMDYRPQQIYRRLHTIGANYSMLHTDVPAGGAPYEYKYSSWYSRCGANWTFSFPVSGYSNIFPS